MTLRFSVDEALEKGWITREQAAEQKALQKQRGLSIVHDGRRGWIDKGGSAPAASGPPAEPEKPKKTKAQAKSEKPDRTQCNLDGGMPQEKLWRACVKRWPEWVKDGRLAWEFKGAVPKRRFRLDIAFPKHKLACEVDGWEHHGKYLSDFKRDRHRDRCLVLQGWRVLRFYAEEIHADSDALVSEIEKALSVGLAE